MRDVFHHGLDQLADRLVEMTGLVGSAIASATTSLLDADLQLAESVIAGDQQIDRLQRDLDDRAVDLLARQQPVATDLRVIVSALRMSSSLERMGDLARHVAQLARLRYPHPVIPEDVAPVFAEMGQTCERIAVKTGMVVASRDLESAGELETDDDQLDRLHRQIFATLLSDSWPHSAEATVDVTLASRYYERFGDHAVSVARRVTFLVTGEATPVA